MLSESGKTGIYFLLQNGIPVYIGKTTKLVDRLFQHKGQLMDYDTLRFIACVPEMLDYYEKRWIKRFNPIENKTHTNRENTIKHSFYNPKKSQGMHFRKMTLKSRVGFGFYADMTVERVIKHGHLLDLCYMYFTLSHITFFDDVLDLLGITDEWRIQKPGVDKDKGNNFAFAVHPELQALSREKFYSKIARRSRKTLNVISSISKDKQYNKNFNQKG